MPSKYPQPRPTQCTVPGCTRAADLPYTDNCHKHSKNTVRHGSPLASPFALTKLRPFRARVQSAVMKYRKSPAIQAAIRLGEELLNWRPSADRSTHYHLQEQMQRLQRHSVTGEQVFCRVAEWAIYSIDTRFENDRVRDLALARAVLHLAPGTQQWLSLHTRLLLVAIIYEDGLFRAASSLRFKIENDTADQKSLLNSLGDFSLPVVSKPADNGHRKPCENGCACPRHRGELFKIAP
jgi:hypothetical protein